MARIQGRWNEPISANDFVHCALSMGKNHEFHSDWIMLDLWGNRMKLRASMATSRSFRRTRPGLSSRMQVGDPQSGHGAGKRFIYQLLGEKRGFLFPVSPWFYAEKDVCRWNGFSNQWSRDFEEYLHVVIIYWLRLLPWPIRVWLKSCTLPSATWWSTVHRWKFEKLYSKSKRSGQCIRKRLKQQINIWRFLDIEGFFNMLRHISNIFTTAAWPNLRPPRWRWQEIH